MPFQLRKSGFALTILTTLGLSVQASAIEPQTLETKNMAPKQSERVKRCSAEAGYAKVKMTVTNIMNDDGNIRIQAYSNDPDDFLEKGKKLLRLEVKAMERENDICVTLPSPGTYALVVMHDRNANGKADFFSEGFGFSNNPKLGLSKPDHEKVVMDTPEGVTEISVRLNYILGETEDNDKRRRRSRRR